MSAWIFGVFITPPIMPCLLDIPPELVLWISQYLDWGEINWFCQANRSFYDLLNPQLYREAVSKSRPSDLNGSGALDWAAKHGKESCVRKLLKAGVPPDSGREEWKPIMLAAQNGHANVVKMFLEYGIDPNPRTGFHEEKAWFGNPLTAAAFNGHEEVVRVLADHGVDLEFTDIYRYPEIPYEDIVVDQPIYLATMNKHVPVIKLLLERGCNPHELGPQGESAVSCAAAQDFDIFEMFTEARPDLNFTDYKPDPLNSAIEGGNVAAAKYLLKEAPGLLPPDMSVLQLFDLAAPHSVELAKLLLEQIDVEEVIRKGSRDEYRHLVLGAASAGLEDLMKRLGEGSCLSQRTPDQELYQPLCSAIRGGRVAMVKLLLDYGADPNSRRMHPLEEIMECPTPRSEELSQIAMLLLQRGSRLSPRDGLDLDFIHDALHSFKTLEVFKCLLETGFIQDPPLSKIELILEDAVSRGEDAFEIVMAKYNIQLQYDSPGQNEALASAAVQGNAAIIKRFLDAGFSANSREVAEAPVNSKPLNLLALVATGQDDPEIKKDRHAADLLLENGAEIDDVLLPELEDSSLFTLCSLSENFQFGISKGVKFLLDLGANPFFTSHNGETVLDAAARVDDISVEQRDIAVVRVLIAHYENLGDAAFEKVKESVVRAASQTNSRVIARDLWHYYWRRMYPCP
jgi:ankyrin repeat protein